MDENCDSYDCVEYAALWGDLSAQDPRDVAVDSSGDSYFVGGFNGALKLDMNKKALISSGGSDAYLIKLDSSSKVVWAKSFGDAAYQIASAATVDSLGNVVIGGRSDGAVSFGGVKLPGGLFLAKFSPDGLHMWSRTIPASSQSEITRIATTPEGDVVCGGYFIGEIDFGSGAVYSNSGLTQTGEDGFIAKFLGADGSSGASAPGTWAKTFGDDDGQSLQGIQADSSGNIVIAGSFEGSINLGLAPLVSHGNHDVFLAKLGPEGDVIWQKRFGDAQDQKVTGFAVDSVGSTLIAGSFAGTLDFDGTSYTAPPGASRLFAAKFSTDQLHEWSKSFGDGGTVVAAFDSKGNALLSGGFAGKIDLGAGALSATGLDVFVAKFADSGTIVWSKSFGDSKDQFSRAIATMPSGESMITGVADGTTDFGTGPLHAAGGWDVFVAKFAP